MGKVLWAIDFDGFAEDLSGLRQSVEKHGHTLAPITMEHYYKERFTPIENRDPDTPWVFYGSLQVARKLSELGHPEGIINNFHGLCCSTYMSNMPGVPFVNPVHVFLPYAKLATMSRELMGYWDTDHLFIKPDSGEKLFGGQVVSDVYDFIQKEQAYLQDMPLETMVFVAPAVNLGREWRIIVGSGGVLAGEIVAGCQYKNKGHKSQSNDIPDDVREMARLVARSPWTPDPIFVVDIAEVLYPEQTEIAVLELNSFSCSGMYCIDTDAVVQGVSSLIEERHRESVAIGIA